MLVVFVGLGLVASVTLVTLLPAVLLSASLRVFALPRPGVVSSRRGQPRAARRAKLVAGSRVRLL